MKDEDLAAVLNKAGLTLFEVKHTEPVTNLRRNLIDRSHYADPETLKAWHSYIAGCQIVKAGTAMLIMERLARGIDGDQRGWRGTAFDVFGDSHRGDDTIHPTKAAALKAFTAWWDKRSQEWHSVYAMEFQRRSALLYRKAEAYQLAYEEL